MIKINLLEERQEKKQKKAESVLVVEKKRRIPAFAVTLLIVIFSALFVMALAYFLLMMNLDDLKDEYQKNAAQMVDLKKKIDEVKKYEELNKVIQQKTTLIETLKKNQSAPARLLDDISKLIPGEAWLTSVTFNNPQIVVEGVSFSNNDVVAFIDSLKRSPNYIDVYLEETKQGNMENLDVYQFKLNFKVRV
jgi:type IV pilus assembly protein PilN